MRCRLVFAFYVCADTLGGGRWPALRFDPISLVLAQRNGVEPPKKSAFLPRRLHHPRERYKSVDGTFLARLGEGLVRVGGGETAHTCADKKAPPDGGAFAVVSVNYTIKCNTLGK